MPRSARPRKAYRPRPVHTNATQGAINGARKLSAADVLQQLTLCRHALQEFSAGRDCPRHWLSLADTANMAQGLAALRIGCGDQADQVIEQAQAALAAVQQRRHAGGSWTLYAAELEALGWLIALHTTQLGACDYAEFDKAFHQTHERLSQARAGNAPRGAVVVVGQIA